MAQRRVPRQLVAGHGAPERQADARHAVGRHIQQERESDERRQRIGHGEASARGGLRLEVVGNADRRCYCERRVAALGELAALGQTVDGATGEDDERDGRGRLEGAFHVLV